jgi:hypothetical protein
MTAHPEVGVSKLHPLLTPAARPSSLDSVPPNGEQTAVPLEIATFLMR